jgi:purine-nucleoside phosphorylase
MPSRPALLLSAFPPELAGLDRDPPAGWEVACTGVGALAAALATGRLLAERNPARVLFVGTCGAYDQRLAIGDLISASEALALAEDLLEGRALRPGIEAARWPATDVSPFPAQPVAVTPGITQTLAGAERLAAFAAAEHLELTGVFAACQAYGVPCAAALAVANRVGPEAHAQWRSNHARVSRELIAALRARDWFSREP